MHDLISFLEANSTLVLANPAVFASFAVLFGGGGFVVGRYLLTERLANLESRSAQAPQNGGLARAPPESRTRLNPRSCDRFRYV